MENILAIHFKIQKGMLCNKIQFVLVMKECQGGDFTKIHLCAETHFSNQVLNLIWLHSFNFIHNVCKKSCMNKFVN